jgi:hypothetical protein
MSLKRILGLVALLLVVVAFFRSPPPSKEETKPAPPVEAAKPIELTPERKAAQEAKKAKDAEELDKLARNLVALRRLRSAMKNPASFNLEDAQRMDDGTLCVFYRATNSFNAIVPGRAVITGSEIIVSDNPDQFAYAWKRRCANKSGDSVRQLRYML